MDLFEIQHEIEALSSDQQKALLDWLSERENLAWDGQIEYDFSADGAGMDLLNRVKAQVEADESKPLTPPGGGAAVPDPLRRDS